MITQLKAEFRKLFSIRSTYVFLALCLVTALAYSLIQGYFTSVAPGSGVTDPNKMKADYLNIISIFSQFIALVSLLLVTHEYRYNTIMYTLTSTNNRLKVFFAKVGVLTVFSVATTLVLGALTVLLIYIGLQLKGVDMIAQNMPYLEMLWRGVLFGWGMSMFAMIFGFIIRNQIGAIVTFLVVPNAIEGLLTLLIKDNVAYMPFTALTRVITDLTVPMFGDISAERAALVTTGYIIAGLAVSAFLFKKRDAN